MKKILFSILLLIFCISKGLFSQVNQEKQNLEKYWKYKERLKNYVVVGDCQGCSLPSKGRGVGQDKNDSNSTSGDRTDEGDLDFPDQTIRLGHYIALLATEYKVLTQNGQITAALETVKELYYALEAFNRLDNTAEGWWRYHYMGAANPDPYTDGSDLNGFFIRDDVPPDFGSIMVNDDLVENQLNNSYAPVDDNHKAKLFSSGYYKGIGRIGKDFPDGDCNFENRISGPTEASLDQIIQLAVGFALISKFIPIGVNYDGKYFKDNLTNDIALEGKYIMSRISQNLEDHDWQIVNSVTGNCATGLRWDQTVPGDDCKCNGGGANFQAFSFGFASANSYMQTYYGSFSSVQSYYDGHYLGQPPLAISASIWPTFQNWPHHNAESFKVMTLAALSNIWFSDTPDVLEEYSNDFIINDSDHPADFKTGSNILLPLLHRALHNPYNTSNTGSFDSFYKCALDHAPCFGNLGDDSNYIWGGQELNGYGVFDALGTSNIEWSGLSYMLMFNLYNIVHPDYMASSGGYNVYDPIKLAPIDIIKEGIILNDGTNNIESDHKNFIASNSITAVASSGGLKYIIENDNDDQPMPYAKADVNFIAGSFVHLAPGFEVHAGADFHAYINTNIKPMDCNNLPNVDCRYLLPADIKSLLPSSDDGDSYANKLYYASTIIADTAKYNYSYISLTPNPNNGSFQISIARNNNPISVKEIKIYNIMGKIIWQKGTSTNSVFDIDISSYSSGIYYVKCITEFDEIEIKKLIKQ